MPLLVRDETWQQNDTTIFLRVPLKGIKSDRVSSIVSSRYVRISFSPYLFECFLYGRISPDQSKAVISAGCLDLQLVKAPILSASSSDVVENTESAADDAKPVDVWPSLRIDLSKDEQRKWRDDALAEHEQSLNARQTASKETLTALSKFSLREQMKIEEEDRKRVEDLKNQERSKAAAEIEAFKKASVADDRWNGKKSDEPPAQSAPSSVAEEPTVAKPKLSEKKTTKTKEIFTADELVATPQQQPQPAEPQTAVRTSGQISVKFTPRVFPTAARESLAEKEQEWLQKQAEARRITEEEMKDLTDNEKNPAYLQELAAKFISQDNLLGAVHVYNHAIKLNPRLAALYSNRAMCHLRLDNLMKCCDDCGKALDLLQPAVEANAKSRLRVHARRAAALLRLGLCAESLMDFEAALKIEPDNEQLLADAEAVRQFIQSGVSVSQPDVVEASSGSL